MDPESPPLVNFVEGTHDARPRQIEAAAAAALSWRSLMRTRTLSLAFALPMAAVLAQSTPARAGLFERIKAGEIISASMPQKTGVWPGQAIALVNAPADLVQEVVANFATYQKFIPRVTGSRLVKDNRFVIEIDLPWPMQKTWAYLTVSKGTEGAVRFVQWRMLNGTLKSYDGKAWIQPWGKDQCLLTVRMLALPQIAAPDGPLTNGMREASASMVEALRNRVTSILKQKGAAGGLAVREN
jgi:hypothetical protein